MTQVTTPEQRLKSINVVGVRQNPDYLVIISQPDTRKYITGYYQGQVPVDMTASYEQPFADTFKAAGGGFIDTTMKMFGRTMQSQALTFRMWSGTTDFPLSVTIDLYAENDVIKEVRDPMLKLASLAVPDTDKYGLFLKSPGPYLDITKLSPAAKRIATNFAETVSNTFGSGAKAGSLSDTDSELKEPADKLSDESRSVFKDNLAAIKSAIKNQISIRIGSFMFLESVVITRVNITHHSAIDTTTGWPMHVTLEVGLEPFMQVVVSDLEAMYLRPKSSGNNKLAAPTQPKQKTTTSGSGYSGKPPSKDDLFPSTTNVTNPAPPFRLPEN